MDAKKLKYVDLTGFKPKQNVSMENTFKNCASLNMLIYLIFILIISQVFSQDVIIF